MRNISYKNATTDEDRSRIKGEIQALVDAIDFITKEKIPKGSIADFEDQKSKKETALKNATTDTERTALKGEIQALADQIEALAKSTTGAAAGSINALEGQKAALEKLFKEASSDTARNRIGREIVQLAGAIDKLSKQGQSNDAGKDANGNTLSGGDIKVEASFTQDAINNLRADLVNVGKIFEEQIGRLIDALRPLVIPNRTLTTVDSSGYTIPSSSSNNKPEPSADMALFASSVRMYESSTSKLSTTILSALVGQVARQPQFGGSNGLDASSVALFASTTQVYATATGVFAGAAREIVEAAADMKAAAAQQKPQYREWDAGKF